MPILGNTLFISSGTATTPIAATKTDEISVDGETIEVSSPTQGKWRKRIAGRNEWSVSVGWLVMSGIDVQNVLNVGQTYTLTFRSATTVYLTGTAILKSCKITSSMGSLVQGSFAFEGSDALAVPSE